MKKLIFFLFLTPLVFISFAAAAPKIILQQKVPKIPTAFLLFSDHPEVLYQNGLLFSAGIIPLRPVRLNYYHQDGKGQPERMLLVYLENLHSIPAVISYIKASPPSSDSIMETGHKATRQFLEKYSAKLQKIANIPPLHIKVLSKRILKQNQLDTGFIQIQELKGSPLLLVVESQKLNQPVQRTYVKQYSNDPHAKGGYTLPHLFFSAAYRIGDPEEIVSLGDLPLPNLLPGKPLKGCYGMIWEGRIQIFNPYSSTKTVSFWFEPRGGSATGTFFLNHKLFVFHYTAPYQEKMIETLRLKPESCKTIHFLSMPEGGSSYPVDFLIRGEN